MSMYTIMTKAVLLTRAKADSAREALLMHRNYIRQWHSDTIGDRRCRVVDGVILEACSEDSEAVRVQSEDDEQDRLMVEPTEYTAIDLQAHLLTFINDAKDPMSDIPPELLKLAEALLEPLRFYVLRDFRNRDKPDGRQENQA